MEQGKKTGAARRRKRKIILTIDVATYERESGERLTDDVLEELAREVNEDAAPIYGYESYETH